MMYDSDFDRLTSVVVVVPTTNMMLDRDDDDDDRRHRRSVSAFVVRIWTGVDVCVECCIRRRLQSNRDHRR